MVGGRAVGLLAAGALIWVGTSSLAAQGTPCPTIVWEKVIGLDSVVPGIEGPWNLDGNIAIAEGRIAFISYTESSQNRGLYLGTPGQIDLVVDRRTPFPGSTGNFRSASIFTSGADGPRVAFSGSTDSIVAPLGGGIFLTSGAELDVVIDSGTTAPGGTRPLVGFSTPSLSGRNLTFTATEFSTGVEGAYLWRDGELIELADLSTPVPGGEGTFSTLSTPRVSGSRAVFLGRDSNSPFFTHGIYFWEDGNLQLVADGRTPAPGGTGNFRTFLGRSLLGSTVYFVNGDAVGDTALYRWDDGTITRLVDETTLDLEGNPLGPLEYVTVTEQGLLLTGGFGVFDFLGGRKLFLDLGAGLCPVHTDGDEIDGVPALIDWQTRAGFDGRYLALRVWFEPIGDGDRALYRGTVIAPQEIPALGEWSRGWLVLVLAVAAVWMIAKR